MVPNIISYIIGLGCVSIALTQFGGPQPSRGTIEPYPGFDANKDATTIRGALKGLGTNDKSLINVIAGRTNAQRQEIAAAYKNKYKRNIIKDIKGDTSGNYENILVALMTPKADYDASLVRNSIKGIGTDFDLLIEVMLSRSPQDINNMREAYRRLYKKDIASSIKGDTNRKVEDLLVKLSQGNRDPTSNTDVAAARADAQRLAKGTGNAIFGFDSKAFTDILATRNYAQLNLIFDQYSRISKKTIEEAIKKGTSGKYQKSLLTLVEIIRNPGTYYARRIHGAVKGLGTKDKDLVRIFTTQSETSLQDIKTEYQKLYKKSLENSVRGDVSGKFQDVLVKIIQGNGGPSKRSARDIRF